MDERRSCVEVVGHGTLRVSSGGRTLLTDPWFIDPIACGSQFHFPPLVHHPGEIAAGTDVIYLSHIHPDHFHPPTLELFSKATPVYIGEYRRKGFRDRVRALGFPVVEVPFQRRVAVEGANLAITIIEHDYDETAAYDSAIVIEAPGLTLFENNDCFLGADKYDWVRERIRVDCAFLGYSPASFFPIAFEMPPAEKARFLEQSAERRYGDFVEAARRLAPRLAIPFASGARFLFEPVLWKNVSFNSAAEAVRRLRDAGLQGEVLGPGDRITAGGSIERGSRVLERDEELEAIAIYAREVRSWVASLQPATAALGVDVVGRFRDYILGRWRDMRDFFPAVRHNVIAYTFLGPAEERFHFDFSRPEAEIFQPGKPVRYDMHYTYPSAVVELALDGKIDWDELHWADTVSVHQLTYARDFYRMLRGDLLDLGQREPGPCPNAAPLGQVPTVTS